MNDFFKTGTIKVEVSDEGLVKIVVALVVASALILGMWVVAKKI